MFLNGGESAGAELPPSCPRCASPCTKFCYFNNYSLSQPRYLCKSCRRYWTQGGSLRDVPVGGGFRKGRRPRSHHPATAAAGAQSPSDPCPDTPRAGPTETWGRPAAHAAGFGGSPEIDMAPVLSGSRDRGPPHDPVLPSLDTRADTRSTGLTGMIQQGEFTGHDPNPDSLVFGAPNVLGENAGAGPREGDYDPRRGISWPSDVPNYSDDYVADCGWQEYDFLPTDELSGVTFDTSAAFDLSPRR